MDRVSLLEQIQQHQELVGESCILVSMLGRVPVQLWPQRPDRMRPETHPTKILTSWTQIGPEGQETTIPLDQVIWIRRPHPTDIIRGIGPVQAAMTDIQSSRMSSEWNHAFFMNGAFPGGVFHSATTISDDEFLRKKRRFDFAHRGPSRAGATIFLEGEDTWTPQNYSIRDMDLSNLRKIDVDFIIAAFGFPRALLGLTDGVPRDVAETQKLMFDEDLVLPRLRRIRGAANRILVPLFGDPTIELDFVSPVQRDDSAQENAERDSKVGAASILIASGFDPDATMDALGLPLIARSTTVIQKPAPAPAPVPALGPAPATIIQTMPSHSHRYPVLTEADIPDQYGHPRLTDEQIPDLDLVQEAWLTKLAGILDRWSTILDIQYASLVEQIVHAVNMNNWDLLTRLEVPVTEASAILADAMSALAGESAQQMADEANAAGAPYQVAPVEPDDGSLAAEAAIVTGLMAAGIATSAAWSALQLRGSGLDAVTIGRMVREHLDSLTDASPRLQIGSALTSAQYAGRMSTLRKAPVAEYYSSEKLDVNTCAFCRRVDRRWLGEDLDQVNRLYPSGKYVECEGGPRCRGQVVVVYRPGKDTSKWIEKEAAK
jgi:hypothetical protein